MISANANHLIKCQHDILELSRRFLLTRRLNKTNDMIDWSQDTIDEYYKYCLNIHVKPTLDFETLRVELIGPRDPVI